MRHGKAERPAAGRSDADRPLSPRGRADATAAGVWLATNRLGPQLVLCSPARRAAETWAAVREGLATASHRAGAGEARDGAEVDDAGPPVAYQPKLYTEGGPSLIALLAGVPDEIETLLVVGHNPTVSIASTLLCSRGSYEDLRTAGIVVHRAELSWSEWRTGAASLVAATTARSADRSADPSVDRSADRSAD